MSIDLVEIIAEVKTVLNLSGSEKRDLLAFNWNRDEKWDVFLYYHDEKKIQKLTDGKDSYLFPDLSNKGDLIVYGKDRDGDENYQIILRDLYNNKEIMLTNDPSHYHLSPRFSPDDSMIVFSSNRDGRPSQLYVWRDGEIEELTRWEDPIFSFEWVSNKEIVYIKGIYETEMRMINISSGEDRLLLKFDNAEIELGDVDRDNKKILFSSNKDEWYDIGEYDLSTMSWRWVYRNDKEKYDPGYYDNSILFIEYERGRYALKKMSRDKIETIDYGVVEYEIFGRNIAYVKSLSDTPNNLIVNNEIVIDNTPEPLKGRLVRAETVYYKTFDGRTIEAIAYFPRDWNRKTVINIHGGPDANAADIWSPLSQLLALRGYAVIMPNYRGSTGYGRTFQHLNDKDLGGGDLLDVVYAGDYARSIGSEKIIVLGASYGGYLTGMALTKASDKWDAGVAIVGFYNWYTEYQNEADYLKRYDSIKMDPEKFYDRSPIFFVENIRAPVLFIHGANDPRCPVEEVYQMSEKLKELGRTYDLLIFPDEGHSIRKDENRKKMYKKIIEFLNRYT
jgi:dipeptidyl aminopeptidase/acylaminoacyl peptidase